MSMDKNILKCVFKTFLDKSPQQTPPFWALSTLKFIRLAEKYKMR